MTASRDDIAPFDRAMTNRAIHAAAWKADQLGSEAFQRDERAFAEKLYSVAKSIRALAARQDPPKAEAVVTAALAMLEKTSNADGVYYIVECDAWDALHDALRPFLPPPDPETVL